MISGRSSKGTLRDAEFERNAFDSPIHEDHVDALGWNCDSDSKAYMHAPEAFTIVGGGGNPRIVADSQIGESHTAAQLDSDEGTIRFRGQWVSPSAQEHDPEFTEQRKIG